MDEADTVMIRTWLDIDGKPVRKSAYQEIVAQFIAGLATQSEAVRKVRDGEMVSANEIEEIVLLFEGPWLRRPTTAPWWASSWRPWHWRWCCSWSC
jgi:selenophosphate synthetase-related protein